MSPSRSLSAGRPRVWAALAAVAVAAVVVPPVLRGADDRNVVELPAGTHRDVVITSPAIVRAEPGAVVEGPLQVRSDDVRLEGLVVVGGDVGISVRDADNVVLDGVTVRGTPFGIDANDAQVTIRDCVVTGTGADHGQAIEIRNSNGRGRSSVEGCQVAAAAEGIVSHVSRVEFRDNDVRDTGMRGIAVTEMSEGVVEGNRVRDGVGSGIFCGDMSHCEVTGNRVANLAANPHGIRNQSGSGIVAWYYSTIRERGNDLDVAAVPAVDVYHGSVEVDRFPLSHWPAGWEGAVFPGLRVTLVAVGIVAALRVAMIPAARRLSRRWSSAPRDTPSRANLGRDLLITTAVVQVFHVGEHLVQVWQVHAADSQIRKGLAGQWFDTEWLHLGFNSVVLAGLVTGTWLARHHLAARFKPLIAWLLAAGVVQSWHVVEHVVRVYQYLQTGVSPAPGVIGADLGLVWFHFGINMSVIAGILVAMAGVALPRARPSGVGRIAPLRHALRQA